MTVIDEKYVINEIEKMERELADADKPVPTITEEQELALQSQVREKMAMENNVISEQMASRSIAVDLSSGRGKLATQPIIFDFSAWQRKADYTTAVDWNTLATYPEVAGGYCKIGQVNVYGNSFTTQSDNWFDSTWKTNQEALERNKLWTGGYIYHDSAWATDRGWTEKGIDDLNTGSTEDEKALNLLKDPNVYLMVRRVKKGIGRVFDMQTLREAPELQVDELVVDFEKYWSSNSKQVSDFWLGKTLKQTMVGLHWLMDHGYLKKRRVLIYTANWFIQSYAPKYGKNVVDHYNTISAGYYWGKGRKDVSFDGLLTEIAKIPNSWHPVNCGAAVPDTRVMIYQISGDYFTLPEVKNNLGRPSAVDVNVFNGSWADMKAYYPEWAERRESVVKPDPVEPKPDDPVVVPVDPKPDDPIVVPPVDPTPKKRVAKIKVWQLNVRTSPKKENNKLVPYGTLNDEFEVLETASEGTTRKWAKVRFVKEAWICTEEYGEQYADIVEK